MSARQSSNSKSRRKQERGRVIVIANLKGGVGKSSIASYLAAYLEQDREVAILDLDDGQRDSERYAKMRGGIQLAAAGTHAEVYDEVQALISRGVDVVVDTPPGEVTASKLAFYLADAVVMPVRPGANDVAAIGRLMSMVNEIRDERPDLQVFTICNFFKGSREATLMVDILKVMTNAQFVGRLADRKDYSVALSEGKTPWEIAPGKPAGEEMLALCACLDRIIEVNNAKAR